MTVRVGRIVRDKLDNGDPVLALETSLFTHGLPRPRNLEVAREAERLLRAMDVEPVAIGVIDGEPIVGLSDDELEHLILDQGSVKASIRELPIVAAKKLNAGVTLAATTLLAHRQGIKVCTTAGIGGVHRGAQISYDESADLQALTRNPSVVVTSGLTSILDVAATMQRLETLSVAVLGYRTQVFQEFLGMASSYRLEHQVDSPEEVAAVVAARDEMGLRSAVVIANPTPIQRDVDVAAQARMLDEALARAEAEGVHGADVTPFVLRYIFAGDDSIALDVNADAYLHNVVLGGRIALAMKAKTRHYTD